jgi:hypothetical protein
MHSAMPECMSREPGAGIDHRHEQLTLALRTHSESRVHDNSLTPIKRIPGPSTPSRRRRRGGQATTPNTRVRTIPSRDSRGRFVAFTTTTAPSWFVFCCDGYRIPGKQSARVPAINCEATTRPRSHRSWFRVRRADVENVAFVLLVLITCVWYRLRLEVPQR